MPLLSLRQKTKEIRNTDEADQEYHFLCNYYITVMINFPVKDQAVRSPLLLQTGTQKVWRSACEEVASP